METRANYTLVGGLVLGFFLAILIFIIWIVRFGSDSNQVLYDIYYKGSVTGLDVGSTVRYRGVPIGTVKTIKIDAQHSDKILVRVSIDKDVILKTGAIASIEAMGITGTSYVQIHGGPKESPPLTIPEGAQHPVIASRTSPIEEVLNTVPGMIQQINKMAGDVRELLSPENKEYFHEILKNLRDITKYLSPKEKRKGEIDDVFSHLKTTLTDLSSASVELHQFIKENRSNVKDFTISGLPAFTKFLSEGREALNSIKRVAESLERSPSRFLYNDTKQGVRAP